MCLSLQIRLCCCSLVSLLGPHIQAVIVPKAWPHLCPGQPGSP